MTGKRKGLRILGTVACILLTVLVLLRVLALHRSRPEEIRRFCGDRLPEYQIPEEIEFTPALPRTERGKIDYRALEKKEQ